MTGDVAAYRRVPLRLSPDPPARHAQFHQPLQCCPSPVETGLGHTVLGTQFPTTLAAGTLEAAGRAGLLACACLQQEPLGDESFV